MSDLLIENKVDSVLELDLLSIWAHGIDIFRVAFLSQNWNDEKATAKKAPWCLCDSCQSAG